MKNFLFKIFLFFAFLIILFFILIFLFNPILTSNSIIFPYAIHPFDIVKVYPNTWILIKKFYFLSFFFSYLILFIKFSKKFKFSKKANSKNLLLIQKNNLSILVGISNNIPIYIPENGLYQNILITGTIGSGKTSSAMYPFTRQLIEYKSQNEKEKLSMLILDVKGNYHQKVLEYAKNSNRLEDVIIIDLSGNFKYNPLDKPNLKPTVLANRLKTILSIFSPNTSESYWLDKAEQILAEAIKFCRLYNDNYVSFSEIHKLIMFSDYYQEKLLITKKLFQEGKYSNNDVYNLLTSIDFFEKEFFSLDSRTLSILKSEISRITNIFISDYNVSKVFCPSKKDINFKRIQRSFK